MTGELAMAMDGTDASLQIGLPARSGERAAEDVERAAQDLVRDAFRTATLILSEHRHLLEAGAARLLEVEALERDELADLFGPRPGADRLAPLGA
jgi:ATP-dependent Zn protease